jgi:predicted nuclease of predicted toxin-antitoxin system
VKLLLDEHLPASIAAELRRHGHDVVAVVERRDLRRSPDTALWAAARVEGRAIVSADVRDFMRLVARDDAVAGAHPGVVLINHRLFTRGGRDVGRLVVALDRLLAAYPATDALDGRVAWLEAEER